MTPPLGNDLKELCDQLRACAARDDRWDEVLASCDLLKDRANWKAIGDALKEMKSERAFDKIAQATGAAEDFAVSCYEMPITLGAAKDWLVRNASIDFIDKLADRIHQQYRAADVEGVDPDFAEFLRLVSDHLELLVNGWIDSRIRNNAANGIEWKRYPHIMALVDEQDKVAQMFSEALDAYKKA